ncbi:MAG: YciI family protein [bacterium]
MITKLFLTLILSVVSFAYARSQEINPEYDSTLAKSMQADDYGMKHYVFAILKTGSNNITDKNVLDTIFAGHMYNINRLAENGSLVLAGPFGENDKNFRGIFVFNVPTVEEALELVKSDPAVREKVLEVELYPWYGSATLLDIMKLHNKISKYNF